MAEVFEAEVVGELGFVRKVAIKRMLGDAAADPGAARRFLDEARIASRLHHANIVGVQDVGLLDGLPFQVLEFVDGIDAQQLQHRAGGVLPLDIALIICADVAHALDHAHRAADDAGVPLGFVHRDVKPSNVLVSWGGDVKLADFGIALARDRSARTETGIVAGTLGFIAPEQRTKSVVDGRADVFALGVTLHALLTGYTPLRDITVEMQLLEGSPLPLDAMLPADVKAVIARAVVPSRLDRPSAAEFASAIGELLAPRLRRDAKGMLREFLQALDAPTKPQRGVLDQFLGVEVVAEPAGPGEVAQFRTVAAASEAPTKRDTPASLEPPPRRRTALYAAIALLAAAAAGIGVWRMTARGTTSTPDAANLAITPVEIPAEAAIDAHVVAVFDAAVIADAPVVVAKPRDAREQVAAKPADARAPDVATETGWLKIVGGEAFTGAHVLVDGRLKFGVPSSNEVAVGKHSVVVIMPDGTKLPAKTIEVTSFHTMQKAARLDLRE